MSTNVQIGEEVLEFSFRLNDELCRLGEMLKDINKLKEDLGVENEEISYIGRATEEITQFFDAYYKNIERLASQYVIATNYVYNAFETQVDNDQAIAVQILSNVLNKEGSQ